MVRLNITPSGESAFTQKIGTGAGDGVTADQAVLMNQNLIDAVADIIQGQQPQGDRAAVLKTYLRENAIETGSGPLKGDDRDLFDENTLMGISQTNPELLKKAQDKLLAQAEAARRQFDPINRVDITGGAGIAPLVKSVTSFSSGVESDTGIDLSRMTRAQQESELKDRRRDDISEEDFRGFPGFEEDYDGTIVDRRTGEKKKLPTLPPGLDNRFSKRDPLTVKEQRQHTALTGNAADQLTTIATTFKNQAADPGSWLGTFDSNSGRKPVRDSRTGEYKNVNVVDEIAKDFDLTSRGDATQARQDMGALGTAIAVQTGLLGSIITRQNFFKQTIYDPLANKTFNPKKERAGIQTNLVSRKRKKYSEIQDLQALGTALRKGTATDKQAKQWKMLQEESEPLFQVKAKKFEAARKAAEELGTAYYGRSLGIDPAEMRRITGETDQDKQGSIAQAITYATADNTTQARLNAAVNNNEGKQKDEKKLSENRFNRRQDVNLSMDTLRDGLEDLRRENILRSILVKFDRGIRNFVHSNDPQKASKVSPNYAGAAGVLAWLTEQGMLDWGRTRSGFIIPLITTDYKMGTIDNTELAAVIDPMLRRERVAVRAPTITPKSEAILKELNAENNWGALENKERIGSTLVSKAMLSMLHRTPFSVNKNRNRLANMQLEEIINGVKKQSPIGPTPAKMVADFDTETMKIDPNSGLPLPPEEVFVPWEQDFKKNGHSTNRFADNFDMGKKQFTKLQSRARDRGLNKLEKTEEIDPATLIAQQATTVANRARKINGLLEEQEAAPGGLLYKFINWYKSVVSGRFFPDDSVINLTNDKEWGRTVMQPGHISKINLRNENGNHIFSNPNREGSDPRGTEYILKQARKIFKDYKGQGARIGMNIDRQLKQMPTSLRQLMGFYYALGVQMYNHDIGRKPLLREDALTKDGRVVKEGDPIDFLRRPDQFIEHGINNFDDAVIHGTRILGYIEAGRFPPVLHEVDSKIFEGGHKGEWQYPASVLMDAARYKKALDERSDAFTFEFVHEEDARQSNAALISALVGDFNTGAILGLLPEYQKMKSDGTAATDLRDLITHNIPDLVQKVLNHKKDAVYVRALINYFNDVMYDKETGKPKSGGAKIVSRGLVVAGLYGKYPGKMYTEALDMLAQSPQEAAVLRQAYTAIRPGTRATTYVDTGRMVRDITQVYQMMATEHMSTLMGYQEIMGNIGEAIAVFEGPTTIDGALPGETLALGSSELFNVTDSEFIVREMDKITMGPTTDDIELDGLTIKRVKNKILPLSSSEEVVSQQRERQREKQFEERLRKDIEIARKKGNKDKVKRLQSYLPDKSPSPMYESDIVAPERLRALEQLGSKLKRSIPVSVIQNMDSLSLALAFMIAKQRDITMPEGDPGEVDSVRDDTVEGGRRAGYRLPERANPPAATAIHDAIISTADSVLLLNNAYNNLAPQILSKTGEHFFTRMKKLTLTSWISDDDRANGDRLENPEDHKVFFGSELYVDTKTNKTVNNTGIANYFDRIHENYLSEFYTPEQLRRQSVSKDGKIRKGKENTNKADSEKKKNAARKILLIAANLGWRPPEGSPISFRKTYNPNERAIYEISFLNYLKLKTLIMEHLGLINLNTKDRDWIDTIAVLKEDLGIFNVSQEEAYRSKFERGEKGKSPRVARVMDTLNQNIKQSQNAALNYAKNKNLNEHLTGVSGSKLPKSGSLDDSEWY